MNKLTEEEKTHIVFIISQCEEWKHDWGEECENCKNLELCRSIFKKLGVKKRDDMSEAITEE